MKDFWPHKFPLILGWDLSGVVEEVGPRPAAAGQFKKGDEVYSLPDPTRNGAYPGLCHHSPIRTRAQTELASSHPRSGHTFGCADRVAIVVRHCAIAARSARVDSCRQRRSWSFRRATRKMERRVHFRYDLDQESGLAARASWTNRSITRNNDSKTSPATSTSSSTRFGGETQERSWSVLKKGGVLVSIVQPPSEEKTEELGVRAAIIGAQPNGAQLAEIATLLTRASWRLSSIASCRFRKCAARTSSSKSWSHPRQNCPANQQRKWNDRKETVMIRGFMSS